MVAGMAEDTEMFHPLTPDARLPSAVGDVVGAPELLRHNKGNAATGGIWRVRGAKGSAVLKLAKPPSAGQGSTSGWPTSDDPAHFNYWRREVLAYETGLAASAYIDAGITAPALLEVSPRADGSVELWLEDVSGAAGFDWTVPRIARFAYELGVGQARWVGRVPETPWLSRRWLAQYLDHEPSRSVSGQDADWDHPRVSAWPRDIRLQLQRLWAGRRRLLAAAEAGERTLCHLDVWPANLIDGGGTSVLLDWSFTGEGAVGEDVANLIVDSCTDGLMDAALLPEIAETAADGYIKGLVDGGWTGSEDRVRSAIAACGAAKYSWFGPATVSRAVRDDVGTSSYRQDTSASAAIQRLAGVVALIAEWAESASA
jgi:Phosphotransferase enzyme family